MRAFHLWTSYDSLSVLFIQNWNSICTWVPFALHFHMCCDILDFVNLSFQFFCRNSMMKNGLTYSLAIWPKMCITFGCSSWENTTLIYTQQRLMTTFMLLNNLHCINNVYKVVHLVMVLIGMNCWWGGSGGSSDPFRLAATMANYTSKSSFTNFLLHLMGKEVFGSSKQLIDCPLGSNNDSHHPNHVNFSCPQVIVHVVKPNIVDNVHM
jgi:hypothetical protein